MLPRQHHPGRTGSTRLRSALLNLFPLPNATTRPATNQYNYAFQTVQDWPRNDQVLRMDWNVAPEHHGVRPRCSSATRSAPAACRSSARAAAGRSMPSKYEIDTVSYVNTLLHTFSPTLFAELTVGVNWAHQYTSAFDDGRARRQRPPDRAARVAAVLPAGEPGRPPAERHVHRRHAGHRRRRSTPTTAGRSSASTRCGTSRATSRRSKGAHNIKAGPVRRAHDPSGAARLDASTARFSFNTDGSNPLQHQRRVRQRAARGGHAVPGVRRPSGGARPVHEHRVVRAGQLAS